MLCPKCNKKVSERIPICPFCGTAIHGNHKPMSSRFRSMKKEGPQEESEIMVLEKTEADEENFSPAIDEPLLEETAPEEKVAESFTGEGADGYQEDEERMMPEEVHQADDTEEEAPVDKSEDTEDSVFDPNSDGYYDDVLPLIAKEINRLPVENVLRIVLTLLFIAGIIAILIFAV